MCFFFTILYLICVAFVFISLPVVEDISLICWLIFTSIYICINIYTFVYIYFHISGDQNSSFLVGDSVKLWHTLIRTLPALQPQGKRRNIDRNSTFFITVIIDSLHVKNVGRKIRILTNIWTKTFTNIITFRNCPLNLSSRFFSSLISQLTSQLFCPCFFLHHYY